MMKIMMFAAAAIAIIWLALSIGTLALLAGGARARKRNREEVHR